MKLYSLKKDLPFPSEKEFTPKGTLFYILNDEDGYFGPSIVPLGSTNGLGFSLSIIPRFDEWFEETGKVDIEKAPHLKWLKRKLLDEIEDAEEKIDYNLEFLKTLE